MIDKLTRDGAVWLLGGFALGTQWVYILRWWGLIDDLAWVMMAAGSGFVFMWFYGTDLAAAIRRRRRQMAHVDYPPMEM